MKVAIISDIHGNLYALERVLEEIEREAPDRVVCLGDVIAFGPQPVEVLRRVQDLRCMVVRGNCDDFFVDWPLPEEDNHNFRQVQWAAERLSQEDVAFMRSFQPTVEVPLEGGAGLTCFHGSPRSNTEIILATTSDDELAPMLEGYDDTVMIGGHTHIQMVRRTSDTLLANSGSIGMAWIPGDRDTFMPWAEWATVESSGGDLRVAMRRTALDVAEMTARAEDSDMPGIEGWIATRRR